MFDVSLAAVRAADGVLLDCSIGTAEPGRGGVCRSALLRISARSQRDGRERDAPSHGGQMLLGLLEQRLLLSKISVKVESL